MKSGLEHKGRFARWSCALLAGICLRCSLSWLCPQNVQKQPKTPSKKEKAEAIPAAPALLPEFDAEAVLKEYLQQLIDFVDNYTDAEYENTPMLTAPRLGFFLSRTT